MSEIRCKTRYPIILVHGIAMRDRKRPNYWGRIPNALREHGAAVFHGAQDANGSIESNARQLGDTVNAVLRETGAEKVNLIAHSKGGLDCRYMISRLGFHDRIASLTTLATPHHGAQTAEILTRTPRGVLRLAALASDAWARLLGDKSPDSLTALRQLSPEGAREFNESVPDCAGVYYQSYAFALKSPRGDPLVALTYRTISSREGENDGVVSVESSKWGEFRGAVHSVSARGISHFDEVDLRRRPLSRRRGDGVSDITDFYIQLVTELRQRGF